MQNVGKEGICSLSDSIFRRQANLSGELYSNLQTDNLPTDYDIYE